MIDLLAYAETNGQLRQIKKRSVIFFQGEVPRNGFIIKSGIVKVYSVNKLGEEQIATFHTAGDPLPAPWLFGDASSTMYYYEAHSDVELLSLSRKQVSDFLASSPDAIKSVLSYFTNSNTGLLLRVTALEQTRASDKILFTLYFLMFRYGVEVRPGIFQISLGLTHSIIANLIGLTRETTATELNRLRRNRIINYKSLTYFVNKSALEEHLGEDSFSSLKLKPNHKK